MSLQVSSSMFHRGSYPYQRHQLVLLCVIWKAGSRSIKFKTFDSGRKLEIEIFVLGNFGAGQKEEADRVFNDFKMKLLEKVGNS
jgi:hypothetical protein